MCGQPAAAKIVAWAKSAQRQQPNAAADVIGRAMGARHRKWIAGLPLILAGCAAAPTGSKLEIMQPQCGLVTFPENERIGPWSVDKFAGRYMHGADTLVVRRDGHRLLVEGWTLGVRQLTAPTVESWTWHDGCGVRYEFTLPPDGPGAWLKIVMPDGAITDWHR
jgi:hypothetical protein